MGGKNTYKKKYKIMDGEMKVIEARKSIHLLSYKVKRKTKKKRIDLKGGRACTFQTSRGH